MSGLMPSPQPSPTGEGATIKNGNPGVTVLHLPCRHPAQYKHRSVQFFRAVQPVTFERTLHVFDGVDDVMVNQFFVLNTDATTAVTLQQQFNGVRTHAGSRIRSYGPGEPPRWM